MRRRRRLGRGCEGNGGRRHLPANGALMRRNHTKQTLNAFSLFEQQVPSRDRAIEKTADCERMSETEKERDRERRKIKALATRSQARSLHSNNNSA